MKKGTDKGNNWNIFWIMARFFTLVNLLAYYDTYRKLLKRREIFVVLINYMFFLSIYFILCASN